MSALAHPADKSTIQDSNPSVTSISTNARIDYIHRFSKQAILVVDENYEVYSQIGSQFLAALPIEHNAAFISVSPKLNNIQIRCRLIEQLFGDCLFDPEQSLAVSVINFAKSSNNGISIVVEQAQNLTLQLLHELCQLAEIAKKITCKINVLLLGNIDTGVLLVTNKSLFENKLAIISAQTGQLIALDAKLFKIKKTHLHSNKAIKIFLALLAVIVIIVGALLFYVQQQAQEVVASSIQETAEKDLQDGTFVLNKKSQIVNSNLPEDTTVYSYEQATPNEIFRAVDNEMEANSLPVPTPVAAKPADIFNAIFVMNSLPIERQLANKPVELVRQLNDTKVEQTNINQIDPSYYLNAQTGYVVQLIGFSKDSAYEEFVIAHQTLTHQAYRRYLDGEEFIVVTSMIFAEKDDARAAIQLLPIDIRERGPWVKSVEAINNEIILYQQHR